MDLSIVKRIESINSGIIPEGYKKTKVGIVPVEWEMIKLKDISKHITEKNKDMKYSETYTNSATHGIIKQTDYFDKQISNAENISGYYVVKQNDYVYNPRISVSAPCGPISKSHFSETGIMSPLYTVFRLNDEYGSNEYIEHYFKSSFWHRYMSSVANYGARHDRMNITNEDLFNMPLPLPTVPEQQKIAEILSTQDKLIELLERKIEQMKTMKKGYLQRMFPKKGSNVPELRFNGFTDPWEQLKLGEVSERVKGNDGRMDLPTLTISAGSGWLDQKDRFSANIAGKEQENYTLLHKGELSYNHGNSKLAKYGAVFSLRTYEEALVPRVYHSFKVIETDADYIEYLFATKLPDKELGKLISSGARMDGLLNINYDEFMGIRISMPSIEEQKKISSYLRSLDRLITLHQRKLDEEKQKKKALMQLLLTGKVRVK